MGLSNFLRARVRVLCFSFSSMVWIFSLHCLMDYQFPVVGCYGNVSYIPCAFWGYVTIHTVFTFEFLLCRRVQGWQYILDTFPACHGPAPVGRPGPTHHFSMSWVAARPSPWPVHPFFRGWAAARPSPSIFQTIGCGPAHRFLSFPGPARTMTFTARPMRYGPIWAGPWI